MDPQIEVNNSGNKDSILNIGISGRENTFPGSEWAISYNTEITFDFRASENTLNLC